MGLGQVEDVAEPPTTPETADDDGVQRRQNDPTPKTKILSAFQPPSPGAESKPETQLAPTISSSADNGQTVLTAGQNYPQE